MNQVNALLDSKALIFKVGKEFYGVFINQIVSIERMQPITPYPNRPEHVLGVTSIRDMVIPVIDFHSALTGSRLSTSNSMRIIVVKAKNKEIGLVVDAATDVLDFERTAIKDNAFMETKDREYLMGVAELEERLIILLDIEKLLENVTNLDELREMVESFREQEVQIETESEM